MQMYYGYKTDGVFLNDGETSSWPDQSAVNPTSQAGDFRYKDISGPDGVPDGIVDPTYDRTYLGSRIPKYTYGANINLNYKNFDFSLFFQGSQGNDIYNLTRFITESSQFASSKTINYVNSAVPGNTGNLPLLINGGDDALTTHKHTHTHAHTHTHTPNADLSICKGQDGVLADPD